MLTFKTVLLLAVLITPALSFIKNNTLVKYKLHFWDQSYIETNELANYRHKITATGLLRLRRSSNHFFAKILDFNVNDSLNIRARTVVKDFRWGNKNDVERPFEFRFKPNLEFTLLLDRATNPSNRLKFLLVKWLRYADDLHRKLGREGQIETKSEDISNWLGFCKATFIDETAEEKEIHSIKVTFDPNVCANRTNVGGTNEKGEALFEFRKRDRWLMTFTLFVEFMENGGKHRSVGFTIKK